MQEQSPRVQATKRGRGGKTVTVVAGLKLKPESLESLAKQLKALCGAGGAVKEGCVEIQVSVPNYVSDRVSSNISSVSHFSHEENHTFTLSNVICEATSVKPLIRQMVQNGCNLWTCIFNHSSISYDCCGTCFAEDSFNVALSLIRYWKKAEL